MRRFVRNFLTVFLGFFGTIAALIYFFGTSNQPNAAPERASADQPAIAPNSDVERRPSEPSVAPSLPATSPAPEEPCVSDWKRCRTLDDLVDHYKKIIDARVDCQFAANHRAKFGEPKWPGFWDGGAFQRYSERDNFRSTGILHLVETNAQYQNGYGAWQHMTVICAYNLKSDHVDDIQLLVH